MNFLQSPMMASVGFFVCIFKLPFCSHTLKHSHTIRLPSLPTTLNSKFSLTSSQTITTFVPIHSPSFIYSPKPSIFTVFAAKGYKRKTHKASAKRFRVTGTGKIVRRRAGKQHLLSKKSSNRKRRLSKMVAVSKSDYKNVMGALPYLKVNRRAV